MVPASTPKARSAEAVPTYNVPDIRLVQNTQFPKYSVTLDWSLLPNGTLDDTQALATAVCVALGTNGLASDTDELPDPDSNDRRGWWGDLRSERRCEARRLPILPVRPKRCVGGR